MARYTEHKRDLIDRTVKRWKERCLLADASLLFDAESTIWSPQNIEDLHHRFIDNPLEGAVAGGTFESKWSEQLRGASAGVRLLAAELLLVHFLFPSSVNKHRKRSVIQGSLDETDFELPENTEAAKALEQGIGDPGMGYNLRRDLQVGYLIDFVRRIKQLPAEDRTNLLEDPWRLRDFADRTNLRIREMRHILLHLLRPEEFERISSGTHKREIMTAFASLLDDSAPNDVDERLLSIRTHLTGYIPRGNTPSGEIDFYHSPLFGVWGRTGGVDSEGVGDLDALEWKKQIVLYGPPGTGKTWQAAQLAEAIIRRAALSQWGPKNFFTNTAAVEAAVKNNVAWLQLHPGYGYEQFIRGLRLEGNVTRYREGFLPLLVARMNEQRAPDGLKRLPGVLVLDEINRTNLSEMLGEAFSLLERDQRGKERVLPGFDEGQAPDVLMIPEDLYVIGTMNEIDQSVETLDFALRRRFLWRECPFERETLLAIIADRWGDDVARFTYEDAAEQMERFADTAQKLNRAVAESEELGHQYEIGHTYFADIAFFIGPWVQARKHKPQNGAFLWTRSGRPQPPLIDLWRRSLKPLLEQYLAGSDVRADELRRLEETFLNG